MTLSDHVPTPDGERRWGDLQPGDRLFGRDGEATHIIARHDHGMQPIYRVTFDDGTWLRVGADHLWTVRGRAQRRVDSKRRFRKGSGRHEKISTYADSFITISTAELVARGAKRYNGVALARQWELPPHGPAQYPPQDVPIAPYLFGALLGDGCFRHTSVSFTMAHDTTAHWQAAAESAGVRVRVYDAPERRAAMMRLLDHVEIMRDLGVAGWSSADKRVPKCYLENSPTVRLALLQGLMDTDGYCMPGGQAIFTSVSRQLAEDVAWLVRSLGGKAFLSDACPSHYRKDGERIRGQDHYDTTVRLPPGMDLFTLPQKTKRLRPCQPRYLARWIESIEPDGEEEAMCVTVDAPDGLYLARDFIVTHNSAMAAWTITWFCNTRAPFKCAVTAPSAPQLFDVLVPETRKWFERLPKAWNQLWDMTSDHIRLKSDQECFITFRTSRPETPEAMAGLHSTNILLVADEASGVDEAVYEAAGGSMSSPGAITLLIGNPTRSTGFFWRAHTLERDRWHCMAVSCLDSPRVSRDYIDEMARRYGENSNAWRIRVLGQFPQAEDDTLIPAELVDSAMQRDVPLDEKAPLIFGVDVARYGNDASCLVKRQGYCVVEPPRRWRNISTMQLAGAIKDEYEMSFGNKPKLIVVDSIGIGAGVVDRLHEQGLPVLGVNVGEQSSTKERFMRLRDEMWFQCKEWLGTRRVRLPKDDQLRDDLCGPKFTFTSDGRIQVESKERMRARGLPSPDAADALILSLAEHGLGVTSEGNSGLYDATPVIDTIPGMEI